MKKLTYYIFIYTIILMTGSCQNSKEINTTVLKGHLGNINDTLFLHGTDRFYDKIDTIITTNGYFEYNLDIDTSIVAIIYSNKFKEQLLFLEPKDQLNISVNEEDSTQLIISGNQMHTDFIQLKDSLLNTPDSLKESVVNTFIKDHPFSISSISALQYFIAWQTNPNYALIESIIKEMPGTLKDRQSVEEINNQLMIAQRAQVGRSALFFNLPDLKGKRIDKKDFKDKVLLLYFWSSWDTQSRTLNKEMHKVWNRWKKYKKEFAMVAISLDTDTISLQKAIKLDSIQWTTLYDRTGWDSQVADRYGIMKLPTTFLINKYGSIISRDVPTDSINKLIEKELK